MKTNTTARPPDDTSARVDRAAWNRLRVLAAQRGFGPGVFLNRILASRKALKAAVRVVDEEAQPGKEA